MLWNYQMNEISFYIIIDIFIIKMANRKKNIELITHKTSKYTIFTKNQIFVLIWITIYIVIFGIFFCAKIRTNSFNYKHEKTFENTI